MLIHKATNVSFIIKNSFYLHFQYFIFIKQHQYSKNSILKTRVWNKRENNLMENQLASAKPWEKCNYELSITPQCYCYFFLHVYSWEDDLNRTFTALFIWTRIQHIKGQDRVWFGILKRNRTRVLFGRRGIH